MTDTHSTRRSPWTFRGAPVTAAPTTWIGCVILASIFFPRWRAYSELSLTTAALLTLAQVVIVFASVLAHELAHAWVASALGRTVVSVELTMWGGVTKSLPRRGGREPWSHDVWISAAGPLTNLVLAAVGALVYSAYDTPTTLAMSIVDSLLFIFVFTNAALGIFNALPGSPMDGGHVLAAIVTRVTRDPARGAVVAAWGGRIIALCVFAYAVLPDLVRGQSPDTMMVIWAAVIGGFLWTDASRALQGARGLEVATRLDIAELCHPVIWFAPTATVAQVLDATRRFAAAGALVLLVGDANAHDNASAHVSPSTSPSPGATGIVAPDALASVPHELANTTPVTAVLVPAKVIHVAQQDTAKENAVHLLRALVEYDVALVDGYHSTQAIVATEFFAAMHRKTTAGV